MKGICERCKKNGKIKEYYDVDFQECFYLCDNCAKEYSFEIQEVKK